MTQRVRCVKVRDALFWRSSGKPLEQALRGDVYKATAARLGEDTGDSACDITMPALAAPESELRARAIPAWLPGIGLVLAIAIAARLLSRFTAPVPDVVLALLAGLIVRNLMRPAEIQKGVSFTLFYGLRTAIIFLGAGISVQALVRTGATTVGLIVALVVVAFALGLLFARIFRLDPTIGTLIGAGTAICGGSAILAIAPLVRAKSEEVAYSITTIFGFNIVALIVYPILGHWLGMSQTRFGSWVGTAVNDTSVVVATGYVFGTGQARSQRSSSSRERRSSSPWRWWSASCMLKEAESLRTRFFEPPGAPYRGSSLASSPWRPSIVLACWHPNWQSH